MKKSLVALAALAVVGAASAQVTITGVIDAGYKMTNAPINGTTNVNSKQEIVNNNTATTGFFFKGNEDLGGGMAAIFLLEMDFNPTSSQGAPFEGTPFNGEQWLGLTGGFGSLKLGTPNSSTMAASSTSQPFGTALGSGYSSTFGRLGAAGFGINQTVGAPAAGNRVVRMEKTAAYTTPSFSGVTASIEYSFGNDNNQAGSATAAYNNEKYQALSVSYNQGPVNATLSSATLNVGSNPVGVIQALGAAAGVLGAPNGAGVSVSTQTAGSTITYNFLAGNYTFGPATVYAGYSTTKSDAAVAQEDANSWNVAAKYVVTPSVELLANYLVMNENLVNKNNAKDIALGANYLLSKRTNLYARYDVLDANTDGKAATAGGSVTVTTAFGIKHLF